MRIPTLLGLTFLAIALGLGIFLFTYNKTLSEQTKKNFIPNNIEVSNISNSAATITWETDNRTAGSIIYQKVKDKDFSSDCIFSVSTKIFSCLDLKRFISPTKGSSAQEAKDVRDAKEGKTHLIHFVTLTDLEENTQYKFRIKEDRFLFPDQPLILKTAMKVAEQTQTQRPVLGKIVDESLKPVNEALVFLQILGAGNLSSITSQAGSFLIPLVSLYNKDLKSFYILDDKTPATLVVQKGNLKSAVQLNLPLENNQSLPPIILGKDLDLTETAASASANPVDKLDLNSDGQVNSLDMAIVIRNFGRNPIEKSSDLNEDGVVNQKDVDVIKQKLQ